MQFPSQGFIRGLLGKPPGEFRSAEYQDVLRKLCALDSVSCSHCGFTGQHDALTAFASGRHGAEDVPVDAGFGLFELHAKDRDPFNLDPANLEVVCEPCFHAAQLWLPGIPLKGDIGLMSQLTQVQLVHLWRNVELGIRSRTRDKSQKLSDSYRGLHRSAVSDFKAALGEGAGSALRISNHDLAYWLGHAEEHIYRTATAVLPDLRFLPSSEMFLDHLDFYEQTQPLVQPQPASAADPLAELSAAAA